MTQGVMCLWSELSSVTLTRSSSRRIQLLVAVIGTCTGQVWEILQVDLMAQWQRSRWTDVLSRALQCRWMSASRDTLRKMPRNERPCVVPMWTCIGASAC